MTTVLKRTRATTTINARNSRRFGAVIPAKQTTESNRVCHGKRCHVIRVWWGLFKKSFKGLTPKLGSIEGQTGRSPQNRCPPNIHYRRGSRRPLEWQICADKREKGQWRLKSPKASSRSPSYKTKSNGWEVKRKVGNGRGDGGDSDPSDLGAKRRKKGKIKGERKRKRAT